jgi:hypothetical protein
MHSCPEMKYVAKVLYGQADDILQYKREHLQGLVENVVTVEIL